MKIVLTFLLGLCLLPLAGSAQTAPGDTTIYEVVEEMPRFPVRFCEELDTTAQVKAQCAQQALLEFVTQRIVYPAEAREAGIQGTAVVNFIVEKNGAVTQPQVVRDPGGQTGLAALQVVLAMAQNIRWIPGKRAGEPVRTRFTLPIRFRLEDPKPYILYGPDTVYTNVDQPLDYVGGGEALTRFMTDKLRYPEQGNDSCTVGQIEVKLLISPDNQVRVLDMTDYNNLGIDFWYEAINTSIKTSGQWIPAQYEGRPVPTSFDLSLSFLPEAPACQERRAAYLSALEAAEEGAEQIANGEAEAGFAKLDAALAQFPEDGRLLIARGQAYLDANRLAEACADLTLARQITLIRWYDNILPVICRAQPQQE
jgi:TonB family protein